MNRSIVFGIIGLVLLTSACQFNQSVNKDLTTGAYYRGDGLGSDDVTIEVNGSIENRNTYIYGEKVNFIFNDVQGLTKENGKVYAGLSMNIVKNQKDTVLSHPDLLSNLKEGIDQFPLQLQSHFIAALPFKDLEEYKVFINVWDKKGDGTFSYEMPFTVEENTLLQINTNGLEYSNMYLWDQTEKLVVTSKNIKSKNQIILLLEGLAGFERIDNKVHPILSIDVTDNQGNKIISEANILKEYEDKGINADEFTQKQLPVVLRFASGQANIPCTLTATLRDKKSDKKIDITTALQLE